MRKSGEKGAASKNKIEISGAGRKSELDKLAVKYNYKFYGIYVCQFS
jgi:hypothetical protein